MGAGAGVVAAAPTAKSGREELRDGQIDDGSRDEECAGGIETLDLLLGLSERDMAQTICPYLCR